ncbi:MAG: tripartite tricarboxylate transporter TctB family protein [Desulfobacterales bacterium]|jgi:putative tricarboxylic transport membrane protein
MKISDSLLGLIAIAFGALIISLTHNFPTLEGGYPGPALFPRILGSLFILFGGILSFQSIRKDGLTNLVQKGETYWPGFTNYLSVAAAVIAYMVLVDFLGFVLTAVVILTLLMKKMGVSLLKSALIAIATSVSINLLFGKFLLVPLPWGILGW